MASGSLSIVGLGFRFVGHVTVEARADIEQADANGTTPLLVLQDLAARQPAEAVPSQTLTAELNPA